MAAKPPSTKARAWVLFDQIIDQAAPGGLHINPWIIGDDGILGFEPDYQTLEKLLGVPLFLKAETQSGVPALALDVWLSYEMRRAGFDSDQVWPRPVPPRILPGPVAALMKSKDKAVRAAIINYVNGNSSIPGVTSSSASILGKNYLKQVDVIMTDWATGPELLISTKRMDSSYGKNAPNRIEESYGDAKNLRLRHPLAALGFVFGLRSDILQKEYTVAEWLFDLLAKLGLEDDAYHATCLILMDYSDNVAIVNPGEEIPAKGVPEPGVDADQDDEVLEPIADSALNRQIDLLPRVTVLRDKTPEVLSPGRFLAAMTSRVLNATPVNMHKAARRRRSFPTLL